MKEKMERPLAEHRRGSSRGGHALTGLVTFLAGSAIVGYLFVTNAYPKFQEAYWLINDGLCLWAPLLIMVVFLRQDPSQFGLQQGDRRLGMKWALTLWLAMLLPVSVASTLPEFRQQYLEGRLSTQLLGAGSSVYDNFRHHINMSALIYYELAMGFYMFCWEFFFRGFLLFGLQKTFLKSWGAVIVQALFFMLLHWSWQPQASKPWMEVLGSFPAALILGWLAIRTKSFLYGYLAHWGVSVTLDLFLVAPFIFRQIG